MLYIVDIVRKGDEHRTTNLPTLQALNDSGLINHIWISSNSTSYQLLIDPRNFHITKVCVSSTWFYRWISSTFLTFFILIKAFVNKSNIFFLSSTPLHTLFISFFSIITARRCKYYVFLHGELSYLSEPKGLGRKFGKLLLHTALGKFPSSNIIFITLAYPVYSQVSKIFGNLKLQNIELPTEEAAPKIKARESSKLRIGSFGVHSFDKNSHFIYDLAKRLESINQKIEIVTIGIANADFSYDQHPSVLHFCRGNISGELVERKLFIEQIKSLDMALIFQGNSPKYQFISSGVFNDCVNYCIPIAGISSSYINYYVSKYGELGVTAKSLDSLAKIIGEVVDGRRSLESYRMNMLSLNRELCYTEFKKKIASIISEEKMII